MSNFSGGVYFEIPVKELDRAEAFYEGVFMISMVRGSVDGNAASYFPDVGEGGGIAGALMLGESYTPSREGARIYLRAGPIEEILRRVVAHGGEVLYPRTPIGELGFVAEFGDSEGNCIALHEPSA